MHFSLFVIGGNQVSSSETTYTKNDGKNIVSKTTTTTLIQSQTTSTTTIAITQPKLLNISPKVQTLYRIENSGDVKIYEIEITGREEVKNVEMKVSFLQENEVQMPFSEENKVVFVYLKIETNITIENILNAKVRFIVEKNWIKSNEIDENKISLYRLEDGNWKKLNTRKIGNDENYNYYETDVNSFSLFAIIGEKKSRFRWYFGLVLVTIFIITMIWIWIFNKTKIEREYEKLKQKWSSGGFGK